jgi:hypothetical protein
MYAVPKTPIFSAKNVEPSQVSPYRFMLSVYRFYFYCMFFALFSFWYVIKKQRNPAMARLVARFTPKIRAIYFLIIKLSAPAGLLKERSKARANPERV